MDREEIEKRFRTVRPDDQQTDAMWRIRSQAEDFALKINELVPDGREKSLALTHLETAVFWANRGISSGG